MTVPLEGPSLFQLGVNRKTECKDVLDPCGLWGGQRPIGGKIFLLAFGIPRPLQAKAPE